ncbi:diguanylate cyclase [Deinococcus sp.]|uniref:diguanylate cyclase domain-containing protein n=1 Tax=Deinococcus sp. TaxID=47478 RepID=UPI0025C2C279|nr:diguanylate cyclase [Deinococcus sp.]
MTPPVPSTGQGGRRPAVWTTREALRAFSWSRFLTLLALLLTNLLTLLGLLWVNRTNNERIVRLQTRTSLEQMIRVATDSTRGYLNTAATMVKINQSVLQSGQVSVNHPAQLQQTLQAIVNAVPQLDGAMVGQKNGDFTLVRRDGPHLLVQQISRQPQRRVTETLLGQAGEVLKRRVVQNTFDPAQRPWFRSAVQAAGQISWTGPYISASSQLPGLTVAATTRLTTAADQQQAVIAMDVQLRGLTRFLQGVQLSPGGRAFITDSDGYALAASRAWPVQVHGHVPRLSEVADPALQALLGHRDRLPPMVNNQNDLRQFMVGGQRYAAVLRQFQLQPSQHWIIGIYAPESDFTGELNKLRTQQLYFVFLLTLLSAALSWPLAFQATRPMSALQHQATTDALTGLQNRASFLAHLRELLAPQTEQELGVVILDLDGFKTVNDTFGHARGDEVLRLIAQRLKAAVRDGDILSRLGGDEFALIIQGATRETVRLRAEGIIHGLQQSVRIEGIEHRLGATAGLAFRATEAQPSAEELLARADKALLRGKRQGKGRVWISGESGSTLLD